MADLDGQDSSLGPEPFQYSVAPEVAARPEAQATATTSQYTVDARNKVEWAFLDIDSGSIVSSTFEDLDWDLAFRRTKLLTNGGITNSEGSVGASDLGKLERKVAVLQPTLAVPGCYSLGATQTARHTRDSGQTETARRCRRAVCSLN